MGKVHTQDPASVPGVDTTVLESGLTVVTERIPHVRSVAFGVWGRAGSRDESSGREGTAHFLEHMFFKGTERRSAFEIAYELERLGGYLNAFTSKDHTCYFSRIMDDHLPTAVDVLSDMLLNARLDPDEVEREKKVVQEEIKSAVDTPDDWVHDLFIMDLFGDHPVAHPVLGSEDSVGNLTREDLGGFIERRYRPEDMLVAAAGSLEHGRLVDLVSDAFEPLPRSPVEERWAGGAGSNGRTCLHSRDISQVHVVAGAEGVSHGHEDRFALVLLLNLLAGGMSSRLFQSLREERGLVYTINSITEFYEDTGVAGFYLACAPENVGTALELIQEELTGIATGNEVPAEELGSAKEQLKGHLMLALESTYSRMSRLAKGLLFEGRVMTLEETLAHIEAVTSHDLTRVTARLLPPGALTVTMLGAVDDAT
ncbi:M16 family metallopeptidase [Gemmatimonadota bacterium]